MRLIITLMEEPIKAILNTFFANGLSLQWLMKLLGLDFIVLKRSLLKPMDNYFLFYFTPDFNLDQWVTTFLENLEIGFESIFPEGTLEISPETLSRWLKKAKDEITFDDPLVKQRIDNIINNQQDITYITG